MKDSNLRLRHEKRIVTLLLVLKNSYTIEEGLLAMAFGLEPKHPTLVGLLAAFEAASFPIRIKPPIIILVIYLAWEEGFEPSHGY